MTPYVLSLKSSELPCMPLGKWVLCTFTSHLDLNDHVVPLGLLFYRLYLGWLEFSCTAAFRLTRWSFQTVLIKAEWFWYDGSDRWTSNLFQCNKTRICLYSAQSIIGRCFDAWGAWKADNCSGLVAERFQREANARGELTPTKAYITRAVMKPGSETGVWEEMKVWGGCT